MADGYDYDPDDWQGGDPDRITAGELRAMGLPVPDDIPDCGNVARASLRVTLGPDKIEDGVLITNFAVTFTEPFTWVAVKITIDKGDL